MMRALTKDALRNIWKRRVSYLSIIVITLLAVNVYLGFSFASKAIMQNTSSYYDAHNYQDIEVTSPYLLTEDDLTEIGKTDGVTDVEGVRTIGAVIIGSDGKMPVYARSISERVSLPEITEGRLPQSKGECALEGKIINELGLKTGDQITLEGTQGGTAEGLNEDTFTVTGIFYHPDHISYDIPITPYVLLSGDSFDGSIFNGAYTSADILCDAKGNRFGEDYLSSVEDIRKKVENLSEGRMAIRAEELKGSVLNQINEGEEELRKASSDLKAARAKLAGFCDTLADDAAMMRDRYYTVIQRRLGREAAGRLSVKELSPADPDQRDLELNKYEIFDGVILDLNLPVKDNFTSVIEGLGMSDEELIKAYSAQNNQELTVAEGETVREALVRTISQELQDLIHPYVASSFSSELIDKAYQGYTDSLDQFQKSTAALEDSRKTLDGIKDTRWAILTNRTNGGYMQAGHNADSLKSVSGTFSVLFIIIAAIVVYASIRKVVEEEITLVGMSKALGLKNREVLYKYLIFGISATLIGEIIGLFTACFLIQKATLSGIGSFYVIGEYKLLIEPVPTILCLLAGIILSVTAVVTACNKLLKHRAVTLMTGIPPKVRKKEAKSSATGAKLFSRLVFFNMRLDIVRVIVTAVGVAGCCALIMIGCSIKFVVVNTPKKQFGDVQSYNAAIVYDDQTETAKDNMIQFASEKGTDYSTLRYEILSFKVGDTLSFAHTYCTEPENLEGYWNFVSPEDHKPVQLTDDGLLVSDSLLTHFNLSVGDEITMYDSLMRPYTAKIAGAFVNYMNESFFCTPAYYEQVFGTAPTENAVFVKGASEDNDTLQKDAALVPGFVSFTDANRSKSYESLSAILNLLVAAMILMSGMLAVFVLANVANTYILERKRELTIMRINGFSLKQTIEFAAAEVLITVIIGLIAGVFLGILMSYRITCMFDTTGLTLYKNVDIRSVIISSSVTLLFAAAIYGTAFSRIKGFRLSDITS